MHRRRYVLKESTLIDSPSSKSRRTTLASSAPGWDLTSVVGALLVFLLLGPVLLIGILTIFGYIEAPYRWLFRFMFYLASYFLLFLFGSLLVLFPPKKHFRENKSTCNVVDLVPASPSIPHSELTIRNLLHSQRPLPAPLHSHRRNHH